MALTKVTTPLVKSSREGSASDADAGAAGYASRAQMVVKAGETVKLVCNPTSRRHSGHG